jgi:transketolase
MTMNYEQTLAQLALGDDRIIVMTAENRAPVRRIPESLGERFIDTGITEQCMIGAAAGLALRGRIVVAHALATFLTMRAFEFIRTDIGIGNLPVKLVGFVPGFLSDGNGSTHQAIEDVSILRGIPPLKIFCPADHDELATGLPHVIRDPAPWYVRYNSRSAVIEHSKTFEIGKAETLSTGRDVAILVYGTLFKEAWEAKTQLEERGLGVTLVNLRTVKPIDEAAVLQALRTTKLTVTLEDHFVTGGLYSIVAELCLRNRMAPLVMPLALEHRWFKPGRLDEVLDSEGFAAPHITRRILAKLQEKETTCRTQ